MDRDTIIRLAREAEFMQHLGVICIPNIQNLERFAALIEDHLTWSDIHTCNPGCTKPACVSMRKAEAHAAAVEREACAKVCDDFDVCDPKHIAAAIRNRSTHDQNDHS